MIGAPSLSHQISGLLIAAFQRFCHVILPGNMHPFLKCAISRPNKIVDRGVSRLCAGSVGKSDMDRLQGSIGHAAKRQTTRRDRVLVQMQYRQHTVQLT
jgi:hypothetical protein